MPPVSPPAAKASVAAPLPTRKIGWFDATMVVIGGIVGAGIFRNPHEVAKIVHSPAFILGAWILGAAIAMAGAFIYAELSAARPAFGGQYAYFRECFHPALAFIYGWALLLVIQTGGMAAVSITFADYFIRLLTLLVGEGLSQGLGKVSSSLGISSSQLVCIPTVLLLTAINCLGVKVGARVQSVLTVLKMMAIAGVIIAGWWWVPAANGSLPAAAAPTLSPDTLLSLGAAMVPVLFAYGGWQTACFVGGEVEDPRRTLPRALILGVLGVMILYVGINAVCLRVLGSSGLAATATPAADVMSRAGGTRGEIFLSLGIVVSTLGFLSQGMLTAPRVYFAMARDGLFFPQLARVHATTGAPVGAILVQGLATVLIVLWGQYGAILNYVVSVDFLFYGLVGWCVFRYRRRDGDATARFRVPGHPWTTLGFMACCWVVVVNSIIAQPRNSLVGFAVLACGAPAYFLWSKRRSSS